MKTNIITVIGFLLMVGTAQAELNFKPTFQFEKILSCENGAVEVLVAKENRNLLVARVNDARIAEYLLEDGYIPSHAKCPGFFTYEANGITQYISNHVCVLGEKGNWKGAEFAAYTDRAVNAPADFRWANSGMENISYSDIWTYVFHRDGNNGLKVKLVRQYNYELNCGPTGEGPCVPVNIRPAPEKEIRNWFFNNCVDASN